MQANRAGGQGSRRAVVPSDDDDDDDDDGDSLQFKTSLLMFLHLLMACARLALTLSICVIQLCYE